MKGYCIGIEREFRFSTQLLTTREKLRKSYTPLGTLLFTTAYNDE